MGMCCEKIMMIGCWNAFTTIHDILFVQFTCLTVLSDNLSPGRLWSFSWSRTLNFIFRAFLHPIIIIFSQHMPIPTLQYDCYVIYTQLMHCPSTTTTTMIITTTDAAVFMRWWNMLNTFFRLTATEHSEGCKNTSPWAPWPRSISHLYINIRHYVHYTATAQYKTLTFNCSTAANNCNVDVNCRFIQRIIAKPLMRCVC